MNNQNTQTGSVSGAGKLDFKALAEDLGTPEEFLRSRLSGEETMEEAKTKLAKSTYEATKTTDQLKGEKSSLLQERDRFREMAEKSLEGKSEPPVNKKTGTGEGETLTPEEEKYIENLLEMANKADEIKQDLDSIKQDLAATKGEVSVTKNYALSQSAQVRAQKLREGKQWLKRTFNEERANELLDEDNPANSPLGRVFDPSLCTSKDERAFAESVASLAWKFENPVEMAYRILAERKELGSAFSKEISETEGAGRSHDGINVSKDKALKDEFLGIFGRKS